MEPNPAPSCPDQRPVDPPVAADPADGEEQVRRWVEAAQQGDRAALESLITHFQDRVWRRALYRLGDHDEAWDVAQEVFILCFRKIGQFRGEARFWTWLARIVDNQVRNRVGWLTRRGRRVTFSLSELYRDDEEGDRPDWEPPDTSPSPRDQAAGHESVEALDDALAELSVEHREVLLLRFADGLAYEEIAEALQISLGTVKSRINRAREQLRRQMRPFLGSSASEPGETAS